MSAPNVAVNPKKRAAAETGGTGCPVPKKAAKNALTWPAAAPMGGVPGWQYPPLPMGMMPPMPYCMPGNPFFPFMGMFPPFWLPAAAVAAATMPAMAAASAANVPLMSAPATMQPSTAMWPMMACANIAQPLAATTAVAGPACTCSGVSSACAFPTTSCTNSVPTVGGIQSPASPPPLAASPGSVCNGSSEHPPEDDEFANFIDSFLRSGDSDLTEAAMSSGLKMFLPWSSDSNCSEDTVDEDPCLTRSDSHSLLTLLAADMGL